MEFTSFDDIINKFLKRLEKDDDFFTYDLDDSEAISLIKERVESYLCEVLDELPLLVTNDVDFSDVDFENKRFNFKFENSDYSLIIDLMYTKYIEKDEAYLHAVDINFLPNDLKIINMANERKSFESMVNSLRERDFALIDKYNSIDRKTGKRIRLSYNGGD